MYYEKLSALTGKEKTENQTVQSNIKRAYFVYECRPSVTVHYCCFFCKYKISLCSIFVAISSHHVMNVFLLCIMFTLFIFSCWEEEKWALACGWPASPVRSGSQTRSYTGYTSKVPTLFILLLAIYPFAMRYHTVTSVSFSVLIHISNVKVLYRYILQLLNTVLLNDMQKIDFIIGGICFCIWYIFDTYALRHYFRLKGVGGGGEYRIFNTIPGTVLFSEPAFKIHCSSYSEACRTFNK
jgi:hypothetical protein